MRLIASSSTRAPASRERRASAPAPLRAHRKRESKTAFGHSRKPTSNCSPTGFGTCRTSSASAAPPCTANCSGAGRVDLTLAHGVLRNLELDGGRCVLVTYDQELRLEGENSVIGKSVLISQSGEAGGTNFCAPIEAAEAEEGEEGR